MPWLQGAENMKELPKTTERKKKRKLNIGFCLFSSFLSPQVSDRRELSLSLWHKHTQTDKPSLPKKTGFLGQERDMADRKRLRTVARISQFMLRCQSVRSHAGSDCKINLHEQSHTHTRARTHTYAHAHAFVQFSLISKYTKTRNITHGAQLVHRGGMVEEVFRSFI